VAEAQSIAGGICGRQQGPRRQTHLAHGLAHAEVTEDLLGAACKISDIRAPASLTEDRVELCVRQ